MRKSIFFLKKLTSAEVGETKTHEKYVRLPNDFDYESFFPGLAKENGNVIQVDFTAKNCTIGHSSEPNIALKFVFYVNSNHEKRMPSLGDIFAANNVHTDDVVCIESRTENGETTYYITFTKSEQASLNPTAVTYSIITEDGKREKRKDNEILTLQQIYYGAPGTGKSHTIDKETNENNRIRTTFHPDYDYATFVGAYKPTVKTIDRYGLFGKDTVTLKHEDNTPIKEDVIVYKFIPQAFIKAYVEAWRRYANAECTNKNFYLVIEEINRGNCAQIFGDLFQLLDRTNAGFSSYAVETESDLQNFLTTDEQYKLDITLTEDIKNDNGKVIATAENVMNGKVLVLPPNLHIWATMNTSDQSLFPIDSAFKRRWDWKYIPIKYDNTDWKVMLGDKEVCKWTELQQVLNDMIYDATESEDKMLGDWFVKADNKNVITEDQLVGKIIFYLWNDVAKVDAGKLFDLEVERNGRKRKVIFSDFYKINGEVNLDIAREWLKNINVWKNETAENETPKEPES